MSLNVRNHLWDCVGGETNVSQGHVGEKVYRDEIRVWTDKMMSRFPSIVTKYMVWDSQKRRGYSSRSCERLKGKFQDMC